MHLHGHGSVRGLHGAIPHRPGNGLRPYGLYEGVLRLHGLLGLLLVVLRLHGLHG